MSLFESDGDSVFLLSLAFSPNTHSVSHRKSFGKDMTVRETQVFHEPGVTKYYGTTGRMGLSPVRDVVRTVSVSVVPTRPDR